MACRRICSRHQNCNFEATCSEKLCDLNITWPGEYESQRENKAIYQANEAIYQANEAIYQANEAIYQAIEANEARQLDPEPKRIILHIFGLKRHFWETF